MSWTQPQLDAIERSIANGSTRVQYADRVVNYRSLDELMRIRDMIRGELLGSAARPTHMYAGFSKGLR